MSDHIRPGVRAPLVGQLPGEPVTPRSYLYVPADRPDLMDGALGRGADAVIIDLEDGVLEANKAAGRDVLGRWLGGLSVDEGSPELWVRVNGRHDHLEADLTVLEGNASVAGISLPKIEDVSAIDQVSAVLPVEMGIIALIESAAGLLGAADIAAHPRVARLALGEADLVADLGLTSTADHGELTSIRLSLVVAAAAAGLGAPIGPASTNFRDLETLRTSTAGLERLGFGARSAIHPAQVPVINEAFTPSPRRIAEARRLVDAADRHAGEGSGVFVDVDGRMVDAAVVRRAHRLLDRAAELGAPEGES